ncbi:hypothetical protein CDIK_2048 [Cucumispora dikerogammari]|nr:hypothetical protein CDIK_2048 [Cucumispora dikerogammari]
MLLLTIILNLIGISPIITTPLLDINDNTPLTESRSQFTVSKKPLYVKPIQTPLYNVSKSRDIRKEHLNFMNEIEQFFNHIANLSCVTKKRQNIEKATGTDPYQLFV